MARIFIFFIALFFTSGVSAQKEVIYHVFQRSFFDSNNDGNGDLEGMRQKLSYLQQLGVTSILLTPLYQSDFYHNYFATDFEKIDPEYGVFKEYRDLVQEVHRRKMKIYQDVEMQYVTGKHPWFTDSYKNPSSAYSKYLVYKDKKNEKPWFFYDVPEFTTYNGLKEQIAVVNMKEPKVKEYTYKLLKYWLDPNNDGNFYDGVDGFRLDHMMDNLDNAGGLKDLFKDFWMPLLTDLKKVNPEIKIVAEQANWGSYGYDYLTKGGVDRVFAFRLKQAIASFDKDKIIAAADSTFNYLPKGKQQVIFIENHDTKRFASEPGVNEARLKIGAALNLLLPGVPLIYYGQEIGMKGEQLKGDTDGNDIPLREAFEWYAADSGTGMALWYKDSGPWWDKRNMKANDGISLEEQQNKPNSLWDFYRQLLRYRKMEPAFSDGVYTNIPNLSEHVISYTVSSGKQKILVMINLSGEEESVMLNDGNVLRVNNLKQVFGSAGGFPKGGRSIKVGPYGIEVWRIMLE